MNLLSTENADTPKEIRQYIDVAAINALTPHQEQALRHDIFSHILPSDETYPGESNLLLVTSMDRHELHMLERDINKLHLSGQAYPGTNYPKPGLDPTKHHLRIEMDLLATSTLNAHDQHAAYEDAFAITMHSSNHPSSLSHLLHIMDDTQLSAFEADLKHLLDGYATPAAEHHDPSGLVI